MGLKSKKTPYQGMWVFAPMMLLPSIVITGVLYVVIAKQQPQFTQELNWASAKIFGFACGILFHIACWLTGAFSEDFQAVKKRLKEFGENIVVSPSLAFTCYWDDVKTLGLAFWIDVALVLLNAGIFVDAVLDFMTMRGLL
jgi:hypothetical protein